MKTEKFSFQIGRLAGMTYFASNDLDNMDMFKDIFHELKNEVNKEHFFKGVNEQLDIIFEDCDYGKEEADEIREDVLERLNNLFKEE